MLDDATRETQPGEPHAPEVKEPQPGSLADDLTALYEDSKTYFEAELAFQKSRAGYAGTKTREGLVFGLAALAFLHLALIGLVVGLVIALGPVLTPFGAVAAVVGVLLLGVLFFALRARTRFRALADAFKGDDDGQA